jgi:site-specific DNA-methyltransferase (adenine-specific)
MISEVHNIDCVEYMRTIPDGFFDLGIIDPPYGIDIAKSGTVGGDYNLYNKAGKKVRESRRKDYGVSDWDKEAPDPEYFLELFRITKNQIIFGANYFINRIPIEKQNTPCWIIWDKENSGIFADAELAWTSFSSPTRLVKVKWNGMWQKDMKNKEIRIHHTQKPVHLYQWILKQYAKEGFKILDTHMGSQSSRIACYQAGLDFYGTELNPKYFSEGCSRFEEFKLQQTCSILGKVELAKQSDMFDS